MIKGITAGLEDYIEAVYIAETENRALKSVELAKELNISRASVSEAIAKLVSKGFIEYERYGAITLTEKGKQEAKNVYAKHNILKTFFTTVLNIEEKEAALNACKIEHIISQNISDEIMQLTSFLNNNPEILEKYRHYNEINNTNR